MSAFKRGQESNQKRLFQFSIQEDGGQFAV